MKVYLKTLYTDSLLIMWQLSWLLSKTSKELFLEKVKDQQRVLWKVYLLMNQILQIILTQTTPKLKFLKLIAFKIAHKWIKIKFKTWNPKFH